MKELNIKIMQECDKARRLKVLQFETNNFEKGRKIKREQKEHYDKFIFFKNLEKAMSKKK